MEGLSNKLRVMIAEANKTNAFYMLTRDQYRSFVDAYIIHQNATKAAIEAGYSVNTARQIGSRLLSRVDIKEAIKARIEEAKPKNWLTPEGLRERTGEILSRKELKVDQELKAIELAGRMTPGTFEPLRPTTQVNFITILEKIASGEIDTSDITIPRQLNTPLPSQLNTPNNTIDVEASIKPSTPADEPTSPPAPVIHSDTPTNKFVEQKIEGSTDVRPMGGQE